MYGMPEMASMLPAMAGHRGFANSAHEHARHDERIPGGSWALGKLRQIRHGKMEDACGEMIRGSVRTAGLIPERRNGACREVVRAVDKHKIPRYDKKPDMRHMIFSKHECGTSLFESYITAKAVAGTKEMHLSSDMVTRDRFNPDFVRKTLQKCASLHIGASLYLLDREFYAADVMRAISKGRRNFVMPAKKDAGIKAAISEHAQRLRDTVSRYTIGGTGGFTFRLVIVPAPGKEDAGCIFERYLVFATSMSCGTPEEAVRRIPEQYRKRWGIETGYRSSKGIRARTTSTNPAIRMLLFTLSLVLANIWVGLRRETGKQAYDVTLAGFLSMMIVYHAMSQYRKWPPPE